MHEREVEQGDIGLEATTVELGTGRPGIFEFLFQEGVRLTCTDQCSIREFLCMQMELCGDYTEKNIQTIFLNGKPVDDVDTAILHEGDRLALSAAMPGVVGATMRKGGYFAKMRHSISHDFEREGSGEEEPGKRCLITVKLFNLLAGDLARDFFRHGVYFPTERFRTLVNRRPDSFFSALDGVKINGELLASPDQLASHLPPSPETLHLRLFETEG